MNSITVDMLRQEDKSAFYLMEERIFPRWDDPSHANGGQIKYFIHDNAYFLFFFHCISNALFLDFLMLMISEQFSLALKDFNENNSMSAKITGLSVKYDIVLLHFIVI